jgi:hypothetical protein
MLTCAALVFVGAVTARLHRLGNNCGICTAPPCLLLAAPSPLPVLNLCVCCQNTPHWLKSVFKLPSKKPTDKDKPRQIDRMLEQLKK